MYFHFHFMIIYFLTFVLRWHNSWQIPSCLALVECCVYTVCTCTYIEFDFIVFTITIAVQIIKQNSTQLNSHFVHMHIAHVPYRSPIDSDSESDSDSDSNTEPIFQPNLSFQCLALFLSRSVERSSSFFFFLFTTFIILFCSDVYFSEPVNEIRSSRVNSPGYWHPFCNIQTRHEVRVRCNQTFRHTHLHTQNGELKHFVSKVEIAIYLEQILNVFLLLLFRSISETISRETQMV